MSRYDIPTGIEGEFELGSRKRVMRNLLGIKKPSEMCFVENEAMKAAQRRYYEDGIITSETRFTASDICRMHEDWLGGIYEWAGRYRTVDLSKDGFFWPPAYLVKRNMECFEADVLSKHTPCKQQSLKEVCLSIAIVHAELLLIHPFREGNGRIARWLADLMAAQANCYPPLYRFLGRGSRAVGQRYLRAVAAGYAGNHEDLARFFEEAILLRAGAGG